MSDQEFWTQDNLRRVSEALRSVGMEKWPEVCSLLKIGRGDPDWFVKGATYGSKPVADYYDFGTRPRYDADKRVVVVENPYSSAREMFEQISDKEFPVFGQYLQIDEDAAMKLLVLGVPSK